MDDNVFTKVMDGVFDGISQAAFDAIGEGVKEYELDQKRPCITTLPYKPIPAEIVEKIKLVKTGLFKAGFKKKLLASIEDGRTQYTEVLLLSRANKVIYKDENNPRADKRAI